MQKHNFSAGPAILPQTVIAQSAEAVTNFNNSGLSLLEISHRSAPFVAVMEEAAALIRELLGLGDGFEVLFLTGGASSQFFMSAMNLLSEEAKACYIDTGAWSTKAIKEARAFGNIDVVASSKDLNYSYIPKDYTVANDARFVHYTSNNTIYGTQFHDLPIGDKPFICDMSSDIFSRPIEASRFALIYAGAQKNLGPAGTTLAIVNKDFLGKVQRHIPTMLDYKTHIEKKSSFNTPPVFPIYVCLLTLRWLKGLGGLAVMDQRNQTKAQLLYDEIDRNGLFMGIAAEPDRSLMNATFALQDSQLSDDFLEKCTNAGCGGLEGHRSAGGFRASIYNAMPYESIEVLVQVMKKFEKNYG